jgi:hypothetical protein
LIQQVRHTIAQQRRHAAFFAGRRSVQVTTAVKLCSTTPGCVSALAGRHRPCCRYHALCCSSNSTTVHLSWLQLAQWTCNCSIQHLQGATAAAAQVRGRW